MEARLALAAGLVAAFGFKEGAGSTVTDVSGTGNNGTLANTAWTTSGKYGNALSFNGNSSTVSVADSNSLDLSSALTLEAWVRPTALSGWMTAIMKERGTTGLAYALYASDDTSRPPAGYIYRSNDISAIGTSALALNTWTHLATTYDGSTLRIYVNGTQAGSRAITGAIAATANPLRIGGNAVWGEYFSGQIDEVRVYNRALTAAEVQTDMNTPVDTPDITPPTVSIASPLAGATVSSTVTVAANAADNVAVAGVQFLLDGVNLGVEDTTSPYSISWNTGAAGNGSHNLTARARDAAGNVTTSSIVSVTVNNSDTTAPTVSVTSPTSGATVSGTTTVSASASDNIGVVGVQFTLDGVNLGAEDATSPYSVSWASASIANGSHTLRAIARDAAGNTTASNPVTVTVSNGAGTPLTVDGSQRFQTIDGFGVNVNSHSWNNGELRPALDMLNDQMGSTLYRVVYDMEDWEATNDNSDPAVANWSYYNSLYSSPEFQELWGTLHYLNSKGVADGITVSFMGRVPTWMGGSVINTAAEDEWVEMMSTFVVYARNTAQVDFSLLDPLNETDWDGIEGPQVNETQYTRLLGKLASRLNALGLSDLKFLGPNTAQISTGVNTYMPAMMGNPTVMSKVDHFAFHNYAGDTGGADAAIKNSAYPNKNFWITEVTNPWDIMTHLAGNPSAVMVWDGFDSAYIHPTLHGATLDPPNDAGNGPSPLAYNSATGIYTPRQSFYQDMQIFKYVPPGSVRIAANESNGNTTIYGFYDPASGRVTLVGRNAGASNVTFAGSLANLPTSSSFQFYKTDNSSNFQRQADVSVAGGSFSFVAPANSFFTLTMLAISDSTPPTVAVTAPADGATVSGTVTISANAADNVGIAGVQFFVDGSPFGIEDTSSPYSIAWNTSAVANGPHVVTARARDVAANITNSAAVDVTVNNDTTPPTVNLTSPANGTTVFGTVNVTANANDNVGVIGVQFLLDGNPLGAEDTSAPFAVSWDTTATINGTHTLTARARDAAGNQSTSNVSVSVANPDAVSPTVAVTSPASGATVSGTAAFTANASDNVGVVGVQFWLDGNPFDAEDLSSPYSVNWVTAPANNGMHTLFAIARDAAGNSTTSASVSFIVSNFVDTAPPTVAVTSPASGATVSGTVTVSANASDNVGVVGVQFLLDGVNLGSEDTTSPYSVSWNTTTAGNGNHSLVARARDAAGNVATSSITVTASNIAATGLVLALGFNEANGTTATDSSGIGNNGTLAGSPARTSGKFGGAISFDGVNDLVSVADANSLDLTNGMTLEAWVNPSAINGWECVILKEKPGDLTYSLYGDNNGNDSGGPRRPGAYITQGSSTYSTLGTAQLTIGAWTHLAVTYNASALRLYVNGTQVGSLARTGSLATSTGALRIGGNSVWGEWFNGQIDEVRIYNRALSAAEIQTDMATPIGGGASGLRVESLAAPSGAAASLNTASLQAAWLAAQQSWLALGVAPGQLANINVRIADLAGNELGFVDGNTLWIDRNAAGYGWSTDPAAAPRADAVDLYTALAHELGHILGLEHSEEDLLMSDTLSLGVRHSPDAMDAALLGLLT